VRGRKGLAGTIYLVIEEGEAVPGEKQKAKIVNTTTAYREEMIS
jgi:hypothetical protein